MSLQSLSIQLIRCYRESQQNIYHQSLLNKFINSSLKSQELYKTERGIYKYYLSPEIYLKITNNRVLIHDYDYNSTIEEVEDSNSRGCLFTSDCHRTSKFISLFFKKLTSVHLLIICREEPEIRRIVILRENYLFVSKNSTIVILEKYDRFCCEEMQIQVINLNNKNEFIKNILKVYCGKTISELLDLSDNHLLVAKQERYIKSLSILSLSNPVKTTFEMHYQQPLIARLWKDYLITMNINGGLIQIRGTKNNEGNLIYSQSNYQALAETLRVNNEKIFFCERGQIHIIYLKSIEDEYSKTGLEVKHCNKKDDDILGINSRIIKLDSKGFIEKIGVNVDEIRLLFSDGIIRQTIILKFW